MGWLHWITYLVARNLTSAASWLQLIFSNSERAVDNAIQLARRLGAKSVFEKSWEFQADGSSLRRVLDL